jgi:hypothetical protein
MIKQTIFTALVWLAFTSNAISSPEVSANSVMPAENHLQSVMNRLTQSLDIGESEGQVKILFSPSMYAESDADKRRQNFGVWFSWANERNSIVLDNLTSVERLLLVSESKVSGDILRSLITRLHFLSLEPDASVDWLEYFLKYKKIDINQYQNESLMTLAIKQLNAPAAMLLTAHGYIVTKKDFERYSRELKEAKDLEEFGYNDRADVLKALEKINIVLSKTKAAIKADEYH